MRTPILFALVPAVAFSLLMIAGLVYYIYRALKLRAAIAPGWSFDRDQQPFLFWLQVGVAGCFALKLAAQLVLGLIMLSRMF